MATTTTGRLPLALFITVGCLGPMYSTSSFANALTSGYFGAGLEVRPDANGTTYNVSGEVYINQLTNLVAVGEYSGCSLISTGNWTLATPPAFGMDGTQIENLPLSGGNCPGQTFPHSVKTYMWTNTANVGKVDSYSADWVTPDQQYMYHVNFALTLVAIKILMPTDKTVYSLTQSSNTASDMIPFTARTGDPAANINWTNSAQYATSGGKGSSTANTSFTSTSDVPNNQQFVSVGGKVTVTAALGALSDTKTIYVVGATIDSGSITARLLSLYQGTTPNLMTGIAQTESTYNQFKNISLYGQSALWPLESYDGGSHIGLMQVPVAMADAFNWQTNTAHGVTLFNQKVRAGIRNENRIIALHTGLARLTASQEEDMGVGLYGPGASGNLSRQVYIPVCVGGAVTGAQCLNGTWQWQYNTAGNMVAVNYVNSVRANLQ